MKRKQKDEVMRVKIEIELEDIIEKELELKVESDKQVEVKTVDGNELKNEQVTSQ